MTEIPADINAKAKALCARLDIPATAGTVYVIADELLRERQRASEAAMHWAEKLAEAGKAPEGWQLVPIEPTPEMIDAGLRARMNIAGGYGGRSSWEAMLYAAPTPPGIRETTE